MFQIGTSTHEGLATAEFSGSLISRYNPEWTLSAYCSYFELVDCIDASEKAFAATDDSSSDKTKKKKEPDFSNFFETLKSSFIRVRDHLVHVELRAAEVLEKLRNSNLTEIKQLGETTLSEAYIQLFKISAYRSVNAECFRRLFERVMRGPAGQSSLELQGKLRQADAIIFQSVVGTSSFDVDVAKDCVVSMMGLAFGRTYETSRDALNMALRQDRSSQPRVMPMMSCYYYLELHRSRYTMGKFATRLLTGTSSEALGRDVEALMCRTAVKTSVGRFSNGEVSITIDEPVRGDDVFVLQSVSACPSKANFSLSGALMELMLLVQTAKHSSAKRVTAVAPFLPYNHRQAEGALIADILDDMGLDGFVVVDMNREQAGGYFNNIPVNNISMMPEFTRYMQKHLELVPKTTEVVVVAPDGDSLKRAKEFADELSELSQRDIALATAVKSPTMLHKTPRLCAQEGRFDPDHVNDTDPFSPISTPVIPTAPAAAGAVSSVGSSSTVHPVDIIGKTAGRICILVDTLIDQGTKMIQVANTLHEQGAVSVIAIATHALFTSNAVQNLIDAPIDLIVVSDSINTVKEKARDPKLAMKLRIVPMAPLLTQAIQRVHADTVVSTKVLD